MGFNDHFKDDILNEYQVMCPHCGVIFPVWTEEQTPGFRAKDILYCPNCKKEIMSSLEVEYHL